jgi:cellobiose phosphorylase
MTGAGRTRRLESAAGLRVELNANGSIRRIDHGDLCVNLFLGSELEGGPANLWLRRRGARIAAIPLLGPQSPAAFSLDAQGLHARGAWGDLRFRVSLVLARSAPAWFWHVALENAGAAALDVDLVWAQDLALADYAAVRLNEYYVSQYLDYTPLDHPERGAVLAVRQNLPVAGRHPWLALGSLGRAASFATDALQLHGLASRAGAGPAALSAGMLPGRRLQHEHSMAVLQEAELSLAPGAAAERGFFAWLEPDHPAASSQHDLVCVERALALPEAAPPAAAAAGSGATPAATLFSHAPRLACRDLDEAELPALFGGGLREVEREAGRVLSFFSGPSRHGVLRAKELGSLRPHGQILRTGERLVPDEASLTSTVWMAGTFHSMLTQGHVSINRFLSTTHGYLGLFRAHGQRVFAELDGRWQLLDVPSAFEMEPSGARWLYAHAGGCIEVRSWAPLLRHELWLSLAVLEGPARRFLVSNHVAVGGDDGAGASPVRFARDERGFAVRLDPDTELGRRFPAGSFRIDPTPDTKLELAGGDELLFADGRSRGQPFLVLVTEPARSAAFRITGHLVASDGMPHPASATRPDLPADAAAAEHFWQEMTGVSLQAAAGGPPDVARLQEILPWLAHDAWIHFLAPRGLEQYSGGGWGTRDVCQGPVELLLALGRSEPVRALLLRVFANQNPDGDWPQWFMFFERERSIRPGDSHGDIVFWPLLALAQYLLASEDARILEERVPFFDPAGDAHAECASVWGHVERALEVIARRVIPGTQLAAYGHGDWNDSLQPVDAAMRERLCSAWTVTLQHQTFATLAAALRRAGRAGEAAALEDSAQRVRDEFQRLLLADGVLAGFSHFHPDGSIERLLHPSDRSTGIRYRLLPMIHAILADLLTPEQARAHVALIRAHLLGPDGARLFDRPPRYQGGPQRHFQRAESSTFFGREIGIMYTHAHLRYAEAMAHWGDAEAFFLALRQANPVGIREVVPPARLRQANCYSSSSDACFADRWEAQERYPELMAGRVPVEGGWRVYSSGAGIALHLVRECLLGLRLGASRLVLDPVLPRALDGLRARVELDGRALELTYRVGPRGHGPTALTLNDAPLRFERLPNPYRKGGAQLALDALRTRLGGRSNRLVVQLG